MARVVVTGGAGFIGGHLCDACLAAGDEVYAADDLSTGDHRANGIAPELVGQVPVGGQIEHEQVRPLARLERAAALTEPERTGGVALLRHPHRRQAR